MFTQIKLYDRFVCNICYAFQDSDNLYLVLELSGGGDLRYHLYKNKKFNEAESSMKNDIMI